MSAISPPPPTGHLLDRAETAEDLDQAKTARPTVLASLRQLERVPFQYRKVGESAVLRELIVPSAAAGMWSCTRTATPCTSMSWPCGTSSGTTTTDGLGAALAHAFVTGISSRGGLPTEDQAEARTCSAWWGAGAGPSSRGQEQMTAARISGSRLVNRSEPHRSMDVVVSAHHTDAQARGQGGCQVAAGRSMCRLNLTV